MKLHQPDSPLARLLSERNARARLLIVDDHTMSLKLAELTFADHFELITANNGPMALALCQQQAPDLGCWTSTCRTWMALRSADN